ncbi:Testis-expressed protein 36 [Merluccius polli]|uniref:Testis-expressed protein 36 n=1 Tax=Merluccius polli TaxID=89951 RepID=A0AA47MI87_MERPO|nr:Testis-expressed protein 36 [Merluccius polli]
MVATQRDNTNEDLHLDVDVSLNMVKGGKRPSSMGNDGKWFAPSATGRETHTTTTGDMMAQVASSSPGEVQVERHPKSKKQSKASPEYPFSTHDNRHALRDSICVFSQGLGRKKCADDLSQHSSHFCLCHDADPAAGSEPSPSSLVVSVGGDQYNQAGEEEVVVVHNNNNNKNRRFPRIPQRRSAEAAAARARERPLMWFGRHDSEGAASLEVLAESNCLPSRTSLSSLQGHPR